MLSRALKGLILIALLFTVVAVGLFLARNDQAVEAGVWPLGGTEGADRAGLATISVAFASTSAAEREYSITVSTPLSTTTHRIYKVVIDIPPIGTGGSSFNVISHAAAPAGWTKAVGESPFGSGTRVDTLTYETTATASRISIYTGALVLTFNATGPTSLGDYNFRVTMVDDAHIGQGATASIDAESNPNATFDDDHTTSTDVVFTVENTVPTISLVVGITTEDLDADGSIESALVVFSEPMDDSTIVAEDFSIGGQKADSFETLATSSVDSAVGGAADDNTIRLFLNTGIAGVPVAGTEAKTIIYTAGTSTAKDIAGNGLANFTVTSIDNARPNITSAESPSTTTIDITFTETITGLVKENFTVTGNTVASVATTSGNVVRLTLDTPRFTDATSTLTYKRGVGASDLADVGTTSLALNTLADIDGTTTAVDKTAPDVSIGTSTTATVVTVSTGLTTSAIDLTFSEWLTGPKSAITLATGDWAVAGNTVTAVATTSGVFEASVLRLTLGTDLASDATPLVTYTGGAKLSDREGNALVNFSTTTTDKIGPKLLSVTWKDVSGDGTINAGDTVRFIFDEEIASTTIVGALDGDLVPSAGTWGTGHGASWTVGTTTLTVTLAGTPTVVAGATVDPAAGVTDKVSNADRTTANGGTAPSVVQVSLTLTPNFTTRNKNQVVSVAVEIADVENLDALAYTITFVAANIRYDSVTAGSIAGTTIPISSASTTPTSVRLVQNVAGTPGVTGSGTLATLLFTFIGNSGTSSALTLDPVSLSDKNGVTITANTTDTTITSTLLLGDGNGDGTLNVADQTAVEQIVGGHDKTTPGADANASGGLPDARDITCTEILVAGNTCS